MTPDATGRLWRLLYWIGDGRLGGWRLSLLYDCYRMGQTSEECEKEFRDNLRKYRRTRAGRERTPMEALALVSQEVPLVAFTYKRGPLSCMAWGARPTRANGDDAHWPMTLEALEVILGVPRALVAGWVMEGALPPLGPGRCPSKECELQVTCSDELTHRAIYHRLYHAAHAVLAVAAAVPTPYGASARPPENVVECAACSGDGGVGGHTCRTCKGQGTVPVST